MTELEKKKLFESEKFEAEYTYTGSDLGAVYTKESTTFKVWSPTADKVMLKLYLTGSDEEKTASDVKIADKFENAAELEMDKAENGVWQISVEGNLEGIYYTYLVTSDGETRETYDIYAKSSGVNGERSMVIDMDSNCPDGWDKDCKPEDIENHPVIYELHVRDFSGHPDSVVRPEWKEKYLAFTEPEGGLEYIKSLGVTYVHLLPVHDMGSIDEAHPEKKQYNWGYDPINYNVPEGSYSTNPFDGHVRVMEFREMVKAFHKAGLGVIVDVVYNHTYSKDFGFEKTVPGYYYRLHEDGTNSDGSACGNDTASERVMYRKYMIESVLHWAKDYHIDGFRFDLMGLHDVKTMNMIRESLDAIPGGKDIIMYGEPWSAAETAFKESAVPANMDNVHELDEKIAVFCDKTRNAIKGSVFYDDRRGYASGVEEAEDDEIKLMIQCGVCAFSKEGYMHDTFRPKSPSQIINYNSAHDDLTLWDKFLISTKEDIDYDEKYEDTLQMNKLAAGIIMTTMGTPFMQAGEEFARTKYGEHNSFISPIELNWLDWKREKAFEELVDYYKFMIGLRRYLPVVEVRNKKATENVSFIDREDSVIGFTLEATAEDKKLSDKKWSRAVVVYNPYEEEKEFKLPEGKWKLISDGHDVMDYTGKDNVSGDSILLKTRSVTVLAECK